MKKLFLAIIMIFAVSTAVAAEKKPISEINPDAINKETQVQLVGGGANQMAIAWWIPSEFWQVVLSKDTTTPEDTKKGMLNTFSGVSLLAVVQADISNFGAFNFYRKEDIERNMTIIFIDAGGNNKLLQPMKTIDSNLEILLGQLKPVLGAAMGNLGNNMHFYVLDDRSSAGPRLADPYKKGILRIQIKKADTILTSDIEMPLNALFIPRKCPNGKDAHVSWKYCPWTGTPLPD